MPSRRRWHNRSSQYATENGVALLYLSVDRAEDNGKWRKIAVRYDLKCEYIIINSKFRKDIHETLGNDEALFIPPLPIFDKGGELRIHTAASSENIDRLKVTTPTSGSIKHAEAFTESQ